MHSHGWKCTGKTLHGRLRHRWEDNIEINLIKVGFGGCELGRWNCCMELFYII